MLQLQNTYLDTDRILDLFWYYSFMTDFYDPASMF